MVKIRIEKDEDYVEVVRDDLSKDCCWMDLVDMFMDTLRGCSYIINVHEAGAILEEENKRGSHG